MGHLSEANYLVYCMHHYDVPTCNDLEEFNNDLKRLGFINRALKSKDINIQLILNHIIVLYNVFGSAATDIILFKVEPLYWKYILPCIIYLNRIDDARLSECLVKSGPLDNEVIEKLRAI